MRIALRTGGGRGVYELAGRQGDLVASNLFGHEISYELTPEIVIPGRAAAASRQGKPRIKLNDETRSKTTHLYGLLAAVLLLPKPKRELKITHGEEILQSGSYSMVAIKVDVATLAKANVVLRPTDLLLENADNRRAELEFTERMARIIRLWEAAETQDSQFAELVREHARSVKAQEPDYKLIERCAQRIFISLDTTGDALPLAEEKLGIRQRETEAPTSSPRSKVEKTDGFGLEDDLSPQEALIKRVKVWRQQAERGAAGRKFSREVANAYDYRCVFSGQRLPRMDVTESPGVESAHILPWSTHNLNSIRNGICLNKQCHWAFDQGILRLNFDEQDSIYVISLPEHVKASAKTVGFDLNYFESVAGPIPRSRLPETESLWPSPAYLAELNKYLDLP